MAVKNRCVIKNAADSLERPYRTKISIGTRPYSANYIYGIQSTAKVKIEAVMNKKQNQKRRDMQIEYCIGKLMM